MTEQIGQPVSTVLSSDSQRTAGRDARSMNITAGSAVAQTVRTTLGPRGMDKMLVSDSGDVVVTNDGVTVLREMSIDHPAADMIADIAETQEAEVGDGTTSAVVFAGALLDEADELIEQGIHSSTVIEGYQLANAVAHQIIDEITVGIAPTDTAMLERIARTSILGKAAESGASTLAPAIVEAVRRTLVDGVPDLDAIKVQSFSGKPVAESKLIEGLMIDREPDSADMPTTLDDVELLVYDGELEVTDANAGTEVQVSDSDELAAFVEREREELMAMTEAIIDAGVDVLFTTGTIDDKIQRRLADAGMLSAENLRDPDIEKLVRSTGAARVSDFSTLSASDLGRAGSIQQELIRGKYGAKSAAPEKSLVLTDLPEATAATLVLRGGTEHVVTEVRRAVDDALGAVATTISDGGIVAGGGASEIEIAAGLRSYADTVDGREQLAVEAAADAIESIPRTLAENGGLDVIDALVDLRSSHDAGRIMTGIDVQTGEIVDMNAEGVIEPPRSKSQAVSAGVEAVTNILRIDDVISVGDLSTGDDETDGGAAGGMDGML